MLKLMMCVVVSVIACFASGLGASEDSSQIVLTAYVSSTDIVKGKMCSVVIEIENRTPYRISVSDRARIELDSTNKTGKLFVPATLPSSMSHEVLSFTSIVELLYPIGTSLKGQVAEGQVKSHRTLCEPNQVIFVKLNIPLDQLQPLNCLLRVRLTGKFVGSEFSVGDLAQSQAIPLRFF